MYTITNLRNLVDYANETLTPIEGYQFTVYKDGCGCSVRLRANPPESYESELYVGRFSARKAAEKFIIWLMNSTANRDEMWDVYDFAYDDGIRL